MISRRKTLRKFLITRRDFALPASRQQIVRKGIPGGLTKTTFS
jgi:hypothetical protein